LPQARQFAEAFPDNISNSVTVHFSPLLDIKHLDASDIATDLDVIFTSENGVDAFSALSDPAGRRAFCVGDRTARAASAAGFEALSASGTATDLIELIASEGAGEVIYARGEHIARDLRSELGALGVPVRDLIVYAQNALPLSSEIIELLSGDQRVIFPLFSARSMGLLKEAIKGKINAELIAVCISKNVANAVPDGMFAEKHTCAAPNSAAMIQALSAVIA
jgi:uroporphyrinogen-III synthase